MENQYCLRCNRELESGNKSVAVYLFTQTVGIRPRQKSAAKRICFCPQCAVSLAMGPPPEGAFNLAAWEMIRELVSSDPALNDASAVGNISIVAGHLYGVSPFYYANAVNKGKEVWETEHYLHPAASQPTMSDALMAAREIHDSLVTGQYNAYLWWWLIDWNPGTGITNDGLIDTNSNPTYFGYALGQYARFIQPGYVRTDVGPASPVNGVYISAYSNGSPAMHFTIVAINTNASLVSQPFTLANGAG